MHKSDKFFTLFCLVGCICGITLNHQRLFATEPAGLHPTSRQLVKLEAFPAEVKLQHGAQRIIVQAHFSDGSTQDVTESANWDTSKTPFVQFEHGVLVRKSAGEGTLAASFGRQSVQVAVSGSHADQQHLLTFRNDVLPVLTKTGCNSGKCHGAASGKDGFRLSLYGFDPSGDFYRLTREMSGRRIDVSRPTDCLLINKAAGEVPHTGGALLEPGDPHYRALVTWIANGAEPDPEETPLPVGIEVFPADAVLSQPGQKQQLIVMASYDDDSRRDVTDMSVFLSNNDAAASVSELGSVEATGPGTAFMLARFDKFTAGSAIVVRSGATYEAPDFAPHNYIDELALERWKDLHLEPSPVASDEVFLRRIYLDLLGKLPNLEEREAFLLDNDPEKRMDLVSQLVEQREFRDLWVMQLAELLQIRRANGLSSKGLSLYDRWLRDQVHAGVSVDEIIMQLIPASGSTFENPPTSYYQTETTPQLLAENIAQAFLGTRIQCAQCHNHPFDRWSMDDYYGFAAFVSQVGYKQAKDPREITVFNLGEGNLEHPVPGRVVRPKFLGGDYADLESGTDYRQALAKWLTSNNEAFARNIANVLWAHFFGVGIVNPVDDVRVSNPPSNPALLNALGERLVQYRFDVRALAKDICNSKTYQLSTQKTDGKAWDDRNFSHQRIRRLRAEVLLDCICQVTQTTESFSGLPLGGRAIEIPDGRSNNYFLETFGRSDRDTPCSCEVSTAPTLSQALHLLNGENTCNKISEGGLVAKCLDQGIAPDEVANKIYQICFCREPDLTESRAIATKLRGSSDVRAELEDLFWAVLNSNEFIFNH